MLHQSPRHYGLERTRWRLRDLACVVPWLHRYSESGVDQVLKRLGFGYKQAQNFIHSPDPERDSKWRAILSAYLQALEHPEEVVFLFMDEFTYYRQPSLARAYHRCGKSQPRARQEPRYNTKTRLVAVLNATTGQVMYRQRSKVGKEELAAFYAQVRAAYPNAKVIYIVQDNWPVHKVPDVMTAWQKHNLTPLFLPTYASWLNPIEKLWRWLKQEVLHLHGLADDLDQLRERVPAFLDQFAVSSSALLQYVGLLLV